LAIARLHGRQARLLKTLAHARLLILDDWAMVKHTADQRRDLMEVIDDRHDRGSTIVATQIPKDRLAYSDWGSDIRRCDPGSPCQQRVSPRTHGQVDARQRRPSGGGGSAVDEIGKQSK
jgi:hypothetical protein